MPAPHLPAPPEEATDGFQWSEQTYRFIAEMVPQLVWSTTAEGYHDYYNQRWYDYTGMPREGAQGWNWKNFLHPDDFDRAVEVWGHSLRTGEPYEIEYRFRRFSDGVYRWFIGRALPQRDESGAIVRWFGTCTDIDDQKAAEAERASLADSLAAERRRLHELFEQAPAVIAVLSGPDHSVEMANPAFRALFGARDLLLRPLREAVPEMEQAGYVGLLDRVRETGEPFVGREMMLTLPREAEEERVEAVFTVVFQPLRETAGPSERILLHAVEVTPEVLARREAEEMRRRLQMQAQQLEEQAVEMEMQINETTEMAATLQEANAELMVATARAEEANRSKSQFLANMSHELRTPLNAIGGYVDLIDIGISGAVTDKQRQYLERVRRAQMHLLGLINDVLNFAKLEAGRVDFDLARFNIAEALTGVFDLAGPMAREAGIAMSLLPGTRDVSAYADRDKVGQILLNLLSNAIKFTPRGGSVRVSAGRVGDDVMVRVQDTGIGIPTERMSSVFEPFVQVKAELTRTAQGTGLGLAISRELARAMGGDLIGQSSPGVGSVFTLTLPAEGAGAED